MDEEHTKKIVHALAAPKPDVDVSLCENCGRMTDVWSSGWPKNRIITWKCNECRERESRKNQEHLERILEDMCDEN